MSGQCAVADCAQPQHGRGLCHAHLEEWRRRRKANPTADPEALRPDRQREVEREQWVREWLLRGKAGPLGGDVCPWRCTWHLRVGIPQVDRFLDPAELEADWKRHRAELLALAEQTGRTPWAAAFFEKEEKAA